MFDGNNCLFKLTIFFSLSEVVVKKCMNLFLAIDQLLQWTNLKELKCLGNKYDKI